jgi:hypothetical protein
MESLDNSGDENVPAVWEEQEFPTDYEPDTQHTLDDAPLILYADNYMMGTGYNTLYDYSRIENTDNDEGDEDTLEQQGIIVLICDDQGPWINPDLLTPDADGNTGDFSWWFDGGNARYDQQQTVEDAANIRPARNHEARAIIANQFGVSEAILNQALSDLEINAKTALNHWHMRGDWGEATYGERVLAGIVLHTAETAADSAHGVSAANPGSEQPMPSEPAASQPEQIQPDLSEQRKPRWPEGTGHSKESR